MHVIWIVSVGLTAAAAVIASILGALLALGTYRALDRMIPHPGSHAARAS